MLGLRCSINTSTSCSEVASGQSQTWHKPCAAAPEIADQPTLLNIFDNLAPSKGLVSSQQQLPGHLTCQVNRQVFYAGVGWPRIGVGTRAGWWLGCSVTADQERFSKA